LAYKRVRISWKWESWEEEVRALRTSERMVLGERNHVFVTDSRIGGWRQTDQVFSMKFRSQLVSKEDGKRGYSLVHKRQTEELHFSLKSCKIDSADERQVEVDSNR
jgi:hypothetical protein